MTYRTWLILTWVALPVIVFLPGWTEAFPHYFIPSIPALSILIALGMMQISKALLQSTANDKPFSLASPIAVMVVIFQIVLWFQFLQYVNRNPTNFGIPLHHRLEVRSKLQQHDDVLLISDGYRTLLDEEAAAWAVMLHNDACLRVVSGGNFTVIPASPFVVLMEPDSPERDIYMSNGEQAFSHYSLHIHDSMNIDTLPEITSIKFDSGVQVTGMALTGNILQLQWQMPHSQPELNLQYFAHFIDANGERIGQRDGDFLPGRWWCAGDTLITQIDVNAPPKTEIIRIGMYQLTPDGGFINTNVLDENGNPIGTWGDVPFQQQ